MGQAEPALVTNAFNMGRHAGGYSVSGYACIAGMLLLSRPWWQNCLIGGLALYCWYEATKADKAFAKLRYDLET